jgi:hypothetical protein
MQSILTSRLDNTSVLNHVRGILGMEDYDRAASPDQTTIFSIRYFTPGFSLRD